MQLKSDVKKSIHMTFQMVQMEESYQLILQMVQDSLLVRFLKMMAIHGR